MLKNLRSYSKLDELCMQFDAVLRSCKGTHTHSHRPYPAEAMTETTLTDKERQHAAGLMRVNHAGEVAAQALYHAQGIVSRTPATRQHMQAAAAEEGDHLAWCQQRLLELGSHTSYLNPVWYGGSFAIGLLAGLMGDPWSYGFVAETEQQVVQHLNAHLQQLPANDHKSQGVLQQMQTDEALHRDVAKAAGARPLPIFIKKLMALTAQVMVKLSYKL